MIKPKQTKANNHTNAASIGRARPPEPEHVGSLFHVGKAGGDRPEPESVAPEPGLGLCCSIRSGTENTK